MPLRRCARYGCGHDQGQHYKGAGFCEAMKIDRDTGQLRRCSCIQFVPSNNEPETSQEYEEISWGAIGIILAIIFMLIVTLFNRKKQVQKSG